MVSETIEKINKFMDPIIKEKRFVIKYNNTEENNMTHEAFKEFSWRYCDGGYLMTIRKLLELSSTDYKYDLLYAEIEELKEKVARLEEQPKKVVKEEEKNKTF